MLAGVRTTIEPVLELQETALATSAATAIAPARRVMGSTVSPPYNQPQPDIEKSASRLKATDPGQHTKTAATPPATARFLRAKAASRMEAKPPYK
jgi:hypothetical protein